MSLCLCKHSRVERTSGERGEEREDCLIHPSFKESSGMNLTAIWIGCKPPEMPSALMAIMPGIQNGC